MRSAAIFILPTSSYCALTTLCVCHSVRSTEDLRKLVPTFCNRTGAIIRDVVAPACRSNHTRRPYRSRYRYRIVTCLCERANVLRFDLISPQSRSHFPSFRPSVLRPWSLGGEGLAASYPHLFATCTATSLKARIVSSR